jgi:hypothetical protein
MCKLSGRPFKPATNEAKAPAGRPFARAVRRHLLYPELAVRF